MVEKFKEEYNLNVELYDKCIRYLVMSSKSWESSCIAQLYYGLFAGIVLKNKRKLLKLFTNKPEMSLFVECLEKNEGYFNVVLKMLLTEERDSLANE